ncbi:MAG: GNAT family N-acetyltransferase [Anaerolineae bacterium]|nr:GNAT family N-acetyltransferase [Anaerolineae bacterium]
MEASTIWVKVAAFRCGNHPAGEVVGCGQIKPHADGSTELASIVVTPPWQGQGIARSIIEHLLETHHGDLYLMCQSSLGPLYEKFGFQAISEGEMPAYFRRIKHLAKNSEQYQGFQDISVFVRYVNR